MTSSSPSAGRVKSGAAYFLILIQSQGLTQRWAQSNPHHRHKSNDKNDQQHKEYNAERRRYDNLRWHYLLDNVELTIAYSAQHTTNGNIRKDQSGYSCNRKDCANSTSKKKCCCVDNPLLPR